MVYRPPVVRFAKSHIKNNLLQKIIINEAYTTLNDAIYPQIPFLIRSKKYNIKSNVENNPKGQLYKQSIQMSYLFRDERILMNYNLATEIRPQVERLIVEAIRHGDKHKPTMELANYWLREKNLVHKLFKVFVPRYENQPSAFTALHVLGVNYKQYGLTMTELNAKRFKYIHFRGQAVLELRGNNLPPIIRPQSDKPNLLTNVLLNSAKENYSQMLQSKQQNQEEIAAQ